MSFGDVRPPRRRSRSPRSLRPGAAATRRTTRRAASGPKSHRLSELHGHFELAVAQRPRADHLAQPAGGRVAGAGDVEAAGLADGQLVAELEGDAAEAHVAR